MDQESFSIRDAVSEFKTKDSTVKSIKNQVIKHKNITFFDH
jgi:hypothetical protein